MKQSVIYEIVFMTLICLFLIKGIITDFGIFQKFTSEEIYTFTYLSFGMSSWLFFDKYLIEYVRKKEEVESKTTS